MDRATIEQLPLSDEPQARSSRSWTAAQVRGITTVGRSLLVSAAAGSGKTAVLAERCAHLVCDAADPCDVDELLVVTFTEAAAMQMKQRITAALRDRLRTASSPRIAQQAALADQANVSTLHSFCVRLLRQHFHRVGLDPSFRVMDGDEAYLLRREIGREILRESYELDESGEFQRFVDGYADGDDTRILRRLLHTHELLTSVVDPDEWLDRSRRQIAEAAQGTLGDSKLGGELLSLIHCELESCKRRCGEALIQVKKLGFAKYAAYVHDLGRVLDYWSASLDDGGLDALCEVVNDAEWEKLPREAGDAADREIAKAAINAVRDQMKSGGWRNVLRFTTAQWQNGLSAILPHVDVFVKLLTQFQTRYRNAKKESRSLDFADLERFALVGLRDADRREPAPSDVARSYHRRFAHVLVDEYQDINEVQDAILNLVSRELVESRRKLAANLFCVGDVKQSIYRFRLAEAQRFTSRQRAFGQANSHGQVIDLQDNFRSRAPLLGAINDVFARLMTRDATQIEYDKTHHLRAGRTFPDASGSGCFAGAPIELHLLAAKPRQVGDVDGETNENDELDRTECEALFVARRIRQILGMEGQPAAFVLEESKDGFTTRPARPGDIVILLRAVKHKAQEFAAALADHGIAAHAEAGGGYFESVEVRDMLALLCVLDNRRQDIPLATVLRSPLLNPALSEDLLATIRIAFPGGEDGIAFHEAAIRYAAERHDELAARLREIFTQIDQWRQAARTRPLDEVIWQIYRQSGYLAFVSGLAGGQQRVANLLYLRERAAQFSGFQRQSLSRFIRLLQELEEESDLNQPSIAGQAQDAVRIMSIHASKGLEFPIVIVPDLGKAMNLSDCAGHILVDRELGLGLSVVDEGKRCRYPSLSLTLVKERIRRQTLAEELRVLYVALTRAKEHLILVGTCREEQPAKWSTLWSGHRGALPTDAILGARSMLDWLGPVAAATVDTFAATMHTQEEIRTWVAPASICKEMTAEQQAMSRLEPLAEEPPMTEAAARAIARVSYEYPFQDYSQVPAAIAVTAALDPDNGLRDVIGHQRPQAGSLCHGDLALPRFLADVAPSAVDRGTVTHLVLQHLDFNSAAQTSDIQRQIQSLVDRHILSGVTAGSVDLDALAWVANGEVGELLREHAQIARRELPIYYAIDPPLRSGFITDVARAPRPCFLDNHGRGARATGVLKPFLKASDRLSTDPLDRTMVRGRVDVLLPLPGGSILIDYKTDSISVGEVTAAAEQYRRQINAYRGAIEAITGTSVSRAIVAFLHARKIVEID